jgi:hypothetical protein
VARLMQPQPLDQLGGHPGGVSAPVERGGVERLVLPGSEHERAVCGS